jgi:hypothetical protein
MMRNLTALILIIFLVQTVYGQINTDSLIGKFVFKEEIGGGFMGGPNGECMTRDPDGSIVHTIIVDSNLVVCKISDTTYFVGLKMIGGEIVIDWGCNSLYLGTGQIVNDSLIVTYTKEQICLTEFRFTNEIEEEIEQFEELPSPIIEKYHIRIEENLIYGLTYWNNGYYEYIKETDANRQ